MQKINLAIQVLPFSSETDKYEIIDHAITIIAESGLKYVVCPFETVLEGTYDEVMAVVQDIKHSCLLAGADDLIINIKLHAKKEGDALIADKLEKYS
jgi:uncharacterized protein YqgV (UPF0045/DUF77 family)